ncbi:putative amidoligase domain-containing protein [Cohnella cellulosilytica]|uniref:PhiEco32-like amidoligase-type 2 protein n=1 Tax=Cohnella cellulosilytica TaxID=986710 RepID=A0ABW2F1U0_9BACL
MTGGAGALKMWIAGGAGAGAWQELAREAGIPLLRSLADAGPNDCVIVGGAPAGGWRAAGYPVGSVEAASGSGDKSGGLTQQERAGYPVRSGAVGRAVQSAESVQAKQSEQSEKLPLLPVSPWLMNAAASEVAALSDQELERRLRREGVSARIGEQGGMKLTTAVWGFGALEMRRAAVGEGAIRGTNRMRSAAGQSAISDEHALWKPAQKLAVRAVYALGLDFGQVELRVSDQGRLAVTAVDSRLRLQTPEGRRRWREAAKAFAAEWAAETASDASVRTLLGADPEFVLVSSAGRVVPASRYFPYEGEAGCDSMRVRGEKIWPLVELRPRPCPEPAQLTAELHALLREAAGRTAGVELSWRAGALPVRGVPLGGHVHVSGAALHGERLRALDNAVALPLRLLEPPGAGSRRPRYGALGDVRRQPHGGFEYRTPPSWLVSPRLALGVFALAKTAVEHARELAACGRPLDEERAREAFYSGDRRTLLAAAGRVRRALAGTAGYKAYREAIDFVFDAIERGRSWNENADIRAKWRIPVR